MNCCGSLGLAKKVNEATNGAKRKKKKRMEQTTNALHSKCANKEFKIAPVNLQDPNITASYSHAHSGNGSAAQRFIALRRDVRCEFRSKDAFHGAPSGELQFCLPVPSSSFTKDCIVPTTESRFVTEANIKTMKANLNGVPSLRLKATVKFN